MTIYDLARQCNLATSTISKVLNNYKGVSKETRRKVLDAVKASGYSPNAIARTLVSKKSKNIGVILNINKKVGFKHYLFTDIFNYFKQALDELGYDILFISNTLADRSNYWEHCMTRLVDGVFVFGDCTDEGIQDIVKNGFPVVAFDYIDERIHGVCIRNFDRMMQLTEHFIDNGHKDIVYICGEDSYATRQRIKAFKEALLKNGIVFNEDMLISAPYYDVDAVNVVLSQIVKREKLPTAILFQDDYTAVYGITILQRYGYSIPDDISVGGFDGIELGQMISKKLTTIRQNTDEIGHKIAQELLKLAENKLGVCYPESEKDIVYAESELICGETCKKLNN